MERLAEQIVDWHNRHPLARRIGVADVHTIGVIALPFVRASAQAGGVVEPVLTDVVSAFDELHGSPPASRWAVWTQRLKGLKSLARLPGAAPRQQWRAFSEKFLPGLSPMAIERFALAHGYAEPPATPESRPWRVIVIDEKLAATHSGWPFELYLMSAGVDVGSARTRVLCGRGIPSQIVGRRLWDPIRTGGAAAVLALLLAVAAWVLWPRQAAAPVAVPVVEPAPAASEPAPAVPASAPAPAAESASEPAAQVDAASAPASAASSAEPAASDTPPDIRPRLVERADGIKRPPLRSDKVAEEKSAEKPGDKPTEKAAEKTSEKGPEKAAEKGPDKAAEAAKPEPADPRITRMAESPDKIAVALVGPAGSKADAEALLKKMRAALVGVHNNPDALQGDVIQTPEGWRATVWPFPSREQAQLINATLVARGLKTKAVNF